MREEGCECAIPALCWLWYCHVRGDSWSNRHAVQYGQSRLGLVFLQQVWVGSEQEASKPAEAARLYVWW